MEAVLEANQFSTTTVFGGEAIFGLAIYRFRLNDHIWITPGAFLVTSPEHDSDNDTIVIGVLRGSFLF